jgi:hypothetical protein
MRQWLRTRWRILAVIAAACLAVAYVAQWQFSLFWKDPIRDRTIFPNKLSLHHQQINREYSFNSHGCQRTPVGHPVLDLILRNPREEAKRDIAAGRFVLYTENLSKLADANITVWGAVCTNSTGVSVAAYFRQWPDVKKDHPSMEAAARFGKDAYRPPDMQCTNLYNRLASDFKIIYNITMIKNSSDTLEIICGASSDYYAIANLQDWPW